MVLTATLDSNILVYAELEPKTPKGLSAQRVIDVTARGGGVLANQALLEFVAVVRRLRPESLPSAVAKVEVWSKTFITVATSDTVMQAALLMVQRHRFQVWDAVIWAAARAGGASLFLSEDIQDGLYLDGITVVNPFSRTEAELTALLDRAP
jgi:predicted nucleic acid-binding protein